MKQLISLIEVIEVAANELRREGRISDEKHSDLAIQLQNAIEVLMREEPRPERAYILEQLRDLSQRIESMQADYEDLKERLDDN